MGTFLRTFQVSFRTFWPLSWTVLSGSATSATPTGPFKWSHAENPNSLFSMDMTEYVDPNDPSGQAYHIRTARHNPEKYKGENTQWTVGSKLSKDYLKTEPGAY